MVRHKHKRSNVQKSHLPGSKDKGYNLLGTIPTKTLGVEVGQSGGKLSSEGRVWFQVQTTRGMAPVF
jgi:hypothetical protein